MRISDIDSKRLLFDIHSPTFEDDIGAKIPEFACYVGEIPLLKIARYIVLMYDTHSPMWKQVLDYVQRKRACAEVVEFPRTKGVWTKAVEDIFFGRDSQFNGMVVSYLRELATPEWSQLIAFHQLQENLTRQIFDHNADKNVHSALQAVTDGIISLTRRIFVSGEHDEVEAMRKALYTQIREDIKRLRPESIAVELRDTGTLPEEWNPYAGGAASEKKEEEKRKKAKKPPRKKYYKPDGSVDMDAMIGKYVNDVP